MEEPEQEGMFQGNELSKLLILLAVAAAGWGAVWYYMMRTPGVGPEPAPVVNGNPKPIVPDTSAEFETVADKKPISLRDMAAYSMLLNRARETKPRDLAQESRRDVNYALLWGDPPKYRGVPVHLLGTARRVLHYESKLSKTGWLYEAYVFTSESQNNPYVCVFEDAPKGLPVADNVSERVVFNGYFLKLMRYEAGDLARGAPVLIGRIGWDRPTLPVSSNATVYWLAGGLLLMFALSVYRRLAYFRRSLARNPLPSYIRNRPSEEIAPEELSEFFQNPPDDDDDDLPPDTRQ